MNDRPVDTFCRRTRREFLWQAGAGFTALGLADLLSREGFFGGMGSARAADEALSKLVVGLVKDEGARSFLPTYADVRVNEDGTVARASLKDA